MTRMGGVPPVLGNPQTLIRLDVSVWRHAKKIIPTTFICVYFERVVICYGHCGVYEYLVSIPCHPNGGPRFAAFAAFRDALNRTGRAIYYSICPHTASDHRGTQAPFEMLYSPPPERATGLTLS